MQAAILALFAANAVILAVMALAFFAAWLGRRQERYWLSWIVANLVLFASMVCFTLLPVDRFGVLLALANSLLVLGLGFRWRAARQFNGRAAPLRIVVLPALLALSLYFMPGLVPHAARFLIVNGVFAVLTGIVCYEFARDWRDRLPSRYGLIAAYGVISVGFAVRAGQSVVLGMPITTALPDDVMLLVGVSLGLFHTVGSGAFALSIAYERGARVLREAAMRDPLTGLYNRRAFERQLQQHMAADEPFAVVFLDVDRFKEVNDRYGHAAGDTALRDCAEVMLRTLRPTDVVARIGGEEFAAILPDLSSEDAYEVVERVRSAVESHEVISHGSRFAITLSGGMTHSTHRLDDIAKLMRAADAGLYRAKQAGRNRIVRAA